MRDALQEVRVPGEDEARERALAVVLAAFAEREPTPRPRRRRGLGIVVVVAAAAGLAVASPPGRAVVDRVREAVGVERSAPALFSLPGGGRLLVTGDDGVWVVEANGKKRLLRGYGQASWSPFGRFLVATRENELAALEPDGDVRWTLARPGVHSARWAGSATDTRIAYVDRSGIRIVAGDGTGDRLLAPAEHGPLAWRPGSGNVLAYVSASEVRVEDVDRGRVLWRAHRGRAEQASSLEWSTDGRRLLVVAPHAIHVYDSRGRLVAQDDPSDGSRDVGAAFRPGTHRVLVMRVHGGQSTVFDRATGRTVFSGTGRFGGMAFSPDARWVVVDWPTADQWVFVRVGRPRTIRAASGIAEQFRGSARIEGWCCRRR